MIPCLPISQSIGSLACSKSVRTETTTHKSDSYCSVIGGNLVSWTAEISEYRGKFLSKSSLVNVPMHPLKSYCFPVFQVTNKGDLN